MSALGSTAEGGGRGFIQEDFPEKGKAYRGLSAEESPEVRSITLQLATFTGAELALWAFPRKRVGPNTD